MSTTTARPVRHRRIRGFGHFTLHFLEMCMPMCIGLVPMLLRLDLYTGHAMGADG